MSSLSHTLLLGLASAIHVAAVAQCGTITPVAPLHVDHSHVPVFERGGPAPFIVPTVVHIHYGGGIQPLGALHVMPLIEECNKDLRAMNPDIVDVVPEFAGITGDMGMELRLATRDENGACISGILYHEYDPQTGFPNTLAPTLNTRSYLNIHIFPSINSFATLPGPATNAYDPTDVIVLSYGAAYLQSRTLSHEAGHWAGLMHTFGWSQTGSCADDGVADTPITAGSPLNCDLGLSNCTPGVVENVQNHMDYSSCRIMFTQGQAEYAAAVLSDPSIVRASVVNEANLLATGITDPSTCAITGGIYHRPSISCDGVTMSYRAMAEHAVADSVHWTFTGGVPATSTDDHASTMYLTSGIYPVQLTVFGGGGSATVNAMVNVAVPDPMANGLSVISSFPFTEGFENGFTLPQSNMFAVDNGPSTWQPFTQAGYASDNSLYIPAEFVSQEDTIDLMFGNFDFSALAQPTVQLKVSSTNYQLVGYSMVQLLFRDQCSNIFGGTVWLTRDLGEVATDQGMNFVPSSDGQWTTVMDTFPVWNMATSAELGIRLVRSWMPNGFTPEAFYIDDLYVGELPVATGMDEARINASITVAPNPTNGPITVMVQGARSARASLRLTDSFGRVVAEQRTVQGVNRFDQQLVPGLYMISLSGDASAVKVLVE